MTTDVVINNVIENLCQKFGVGASALIPRIQQYKMATTMYGCVASMGFILIFTIIFIGVMLRFRARDKEEQYFDTDNYTMAVAIYLMAILIPTVVLLCNIYDYIGWKYAAEVKTIEYVMSLIKKG